MVDRVGKSAALEMAPSGAASGRSAPAKCARYSADWADRLSPTQSTTRARRPTGRRQRGGAPRQPSCTAGKHLAQFNQDDVLRVMVIVDLCGGQGSFANMPADDPGFNNETTAAASDRARAVKPASAESPSVRTQGPPTGGADGEARPQSPRLHQRDLRGPGRAGQIGSRATRPVIGSVTTSVRIAPPGAHRRTRSATSMDRPATSPT